MAYSVSGKTALITGGAQRIGREIALTLARSGCHILVHYHRSAAEAEALCAEIRLLGAEAWTIAADFADPAASETLFARALERVGTVDILVNNAAIFPLDSLETMQFEHWLDNMRVNAWVPFMLGRELYRRAGQGKIINLLDSSLQGYDWKHVSYMLSKQALELLTRMMALEFAPRVTVNAVAPGLILPPPGRSTDYLERMKEHVPLKAHGNPQGVAEAMLFLLQSEYVTGDIIYVDGGRQSCSHSRSRRRCPLP